MPLCCSGGEIIVDQPLKTIEHKIGLHAVAPDGKESKTLFRRLSYNGRTSAVYCRPFTGRTHQIRVHLQWLGFPIANDPLYSYEAAWGPSLGKGGCTAAELDEVKTNFFVQGIELLVIFQVVKRYIADRVHLDVLAKSLQSDAPVDTTAGPTGDNTAGPTGDTTTRPIDSQTDDGPAAVPMPPSSSSLPLEASTTMTDNLVRLPNLIRDPLPHELCIWLHAYKYSGPGFSYEAPQPAWAADDFTADEWVLNPLAVSTMAALSLAFDAGAAAAADAGAAAAAGAGSTSGAADDVAELS